MIWPEQRGAVKRICVVCAAGDVDGEIAHCSGELGIMCWLGLKVNATSPLAVGKNDPECSWPLAGIRRVYVTTMTHVDSSSRASLQECMCCNFLAGIQFSRPVRMTRMFVRTCRAVMHTVAIFLPPTVVLLIAFRFHHCIFE